MPSDIDVDRQHPILVARVARADGSTKLGLRVYCGARGRSVPLELCRECPGCHEVSLDEGGSTGWIRCTPPPEQRRDDDRLLSVGDALHEGVVAVEEDMPVRNVIDLFVERALRLAVVLDRDGRVVGVVHESHLVPQIQAYTQGGAPHVLRLEASLVEDSLVSEIMSSARSISERVSLRTALEEMAAARHQRLVATDDDERPVGILVDVHGLLALRSGEARRG